MSESAPTYSKDPILKFGQEIGHGIHEAESHTIGALVHGVRDVLVIADEFKKQMPTVLEETAQAIDAIGDPDLIALDAAMGSVMLTPANPLAWWTLIGCMLKAPAKIQILMAKWRTLSTTLGADFKTDIASLEGTK
jgi:hypothetical protein